MARAVHHLSIEQIEQVARSVALLPAQPVHVIASGSGPLTIQRSLGEHFELWHLTDLRQLAPGERLETRANASGLVHHQIRHGGQPKQYAWSRAREDGHRRVVGLFNSELSRRVHDAVRWIDAELDTTADEPVRLLALPLPRLHALWLSGASVDRLVVIHDALARRQPTFKARTARQVIGTLARRLTRLGSLARDKR